MGCGASSSAPRHAEEPFDGQDDDPPPLRTQNSSGSSGPKMVVDVNGHSAFVQVHDEVEVQKKTEMGAGVIAMMDLLTKVCVFFCLYSILLHFIMAQ